MITIQTDDISEKQLAEIALAIQNRWNVPTFVKMHEIVVMDDDLEGPAQREVVNDFDRGLDTIFSNLELTSAFRCEKHGKNKFTISRIADSELPSWMEAIEKPTRTPEGVYECPHCGKWFGTDVELSLHTKLHYIAF